MFFATSEYREGMQCIPFLSGVHSMGNNLWVKVPRGVFVEELKQLAKRKPVMEFEKKVSGRQVEVKVFRFRGKILMYKKVFYIFYFCTYF